MNCTAVAIIQARIRSERLFEKSILPLCGIPMLLHIIERAGAIEGVSKVIVATGNRTDNQKIEDIAAERAEIFFGNEYDVLSRYYLAAKQYNPDYIVRITGDNPFTDVDLASSALAQAVSAKTDLASISDIPVGTAVEIISFGALEQAYMNAATDYQHEHVTPYIKEHPELFTISRFSPPEKLRKPSLRLTVDTVEDFSLATAIYDRLFHGTFFPLSRILQLIEAEPQLQLMNKHIEQRPMTHSQERI